MRQSGTQFVCQLLRTGTGIPVPVLKEASIGAGATSFYWVSVRQGAKKQGASMEIALATDSRVSSLTRTLSCIVRAIVFGPVLFGLACNTLHAREQAIALEHGPEQQAVSNFDSVLGWINGRFTSAEIEKMSPEDFRIEPHACSCADKPDPHFPYLVVLFTTPKGDLVARPDGHENMTKFTPLAVRRGEHYCMVDSEEQCYGSFANVCEFTDFRYGSMLEQVFPTCKTADN
jgi:hypothetical protein